MWLGFSTLIVDGRQWAVITMTRMAMSRVIVLRLKTGYEEKFISIPEDELGSYIGKVNPQRTFDIRADSDNDEPQPPELLTEAEPEAEEPIDIDPTTILHSEECLANTDMQECVEGCPVAVWYASQPTETETSDD